MVSASVRWNGRQTAAAARAAGIRGAKKAAERLAALSAPLTPYLTGDLDRTRDIQSTEDADGAASAVVYSGDYAVRQHEEMDYRHTLDPHPEAQAKFLESPLVEHARELTGILAAEQRRALRG